MLRVMEERKFYSKLCVARSLKSSVGKRCLNEFVPSGWDKLSYNLATILVKDKVVVAVNLRVLSNRCEISIAKDGVWLEEDHKYVNKIKETLANISKDAPMTFKQTHSREDMIDLSSTILNYCSKIIRNRSDKLRKSITENKDENYIKSFLEFVKTRINVDDIYNDEKIVSISTVCCEYYYIAKKDPATPKSFLKRIRKVGSCVESLFGITNFVCKTKYTLIFSYGFAIIGSCCDDSTHFTME